MRNLNIAIAAIAGVLSFGGAASADTSAYNSYTTTVQYGGHSTTEIEAELNSHEVVTTNSSTTKVEAVADKGTLNIAAVEYKDGKFTANSFSSNGAPIDPVATIYVSTVDQNSVKNITESATINTKSGFNFSSVNFTHEVGNRF